MRVTCFLCERVDEIDDNSLLAKRIRHRPLTPYLCPACHDRIAQKTLARRRQSLGEAKSPPKKQGRS
ncbi:MAG TPA: DUF2197 domain-containing protein [Calditerricola sp.]